MEDLRSRLARFDRAARPAAVAPAADADPLAAVRALGARWCGEAPTGFLRIERLLPGGADRSCVDVFDAEIPEGDILVLDTETTGLESGTGTMVFVVGFVRWSGTTQMLVQYFLPEPAGERSFLRAVASEFETAVGIVSYNGRGFDVPRLRARMRLQRIDDAVLDRPHADLLYPIRRLTRGWLGDARLKTVEEALLGLRREGDLPGEFAPEVYRVLQLEGRDTGLADVIRHNALDVERLPLLADRVAGLYSNGGAAGFPPSCRLEVARRLLDRGDARRARALLEDLSAGEDPRARGEARAMLARTLRRDGDFAGAASYWLAHLSDQPRDLHARVELAKLLEHRLSDPEAALALVAEARTLLSLRPGFDAALSEALDHRYRRLVRRIGRMR